MAHTEDEFLDHVREMFQQEEFPYQPGAWENFQRQNRRKRNLLWLRWTSQAAVFLLFFLALFYWDKSFLKEENHRKTEGKSRIVKLQKQPSEKMNLFQEQPVSSQKQNRYSRFQNKIKEEKISVVKYVTDTSVSVGKTAENPPQKKSAGTPEPLKTPSAAPTQRNNNPFYALSEDSGHEGRVLESWKYNVQVSGGYGNSSKPNIGLGANVEYSLNSRLSLASGLSFYQLSSLNRLGPAPEDVPGKNLASVQTSVSGIDLPLDLKYHLSSRSYLTAGISVTGVLRKAQVLAYDERKYVSVPVDGEDGPGYESKLMYSTEVVPVAPEELPHQKYLGFYNLSYGFGQKINKKQQLIIEPFFRIPMKLYSDQKVNLTSGGIKLKLEL